MQTTSDTPLILTYIDRVLSGDLESFYKGLSDHFVQDIIIWPLYHQCVLWFGSTYRTIGVIRDQAFYTGNSKFIPEKGICEINLIKNHQID